MMRTFRLLLSYCLSDLTALTTPIILTKSETEKVIACVYEGSDCPTFVWKVDGVAQEARVDSVWYTVDYGNTDNCDPSGASISSTITVLKEALGSLRKLTCLVKFEESRFETISTETDVLRTGTSFSSSWLIQ